jgi:uncharacterized protein (TIGR00369 family)
MQDNFFWKMHRGELPPPNIAKTLGMVFIDINTDAQTLKASFDITEEFTNPAGNIQGGIIAAMLDDTMGPALVATLEANQFAPTLNLNVSFIKGAKPGKFFATGKVINKGRSICYLSGELFDSDNNLIATATATAKITKV